MAQEGHQGRPDDRALPPEAPNSLQEDSKGSTHTHTGLHTLRIPPTLGSTHSATRIRRLGPLRCNVLLPQKHRTQDCLCSVSRWPSSRCGPKTVPGWPRTPPQDGHRIPRDSEILPQTAPRPPEDPAEKPATGRAHKATAPDTLSRGIATSMFQEEPRGPLQTRPQRASHRHSLHTPSPPGQATALP
eukprot:7789219-Pyramimonas_sp.AAC.1